MTMESLWAVSPMDGRYADRMGNLGCIFSEGALIRHRVMVEARWLLFLTRNVGALRFATEHEQAQLEALAHDVPDQLITEVKALEDVLNHDVKAVEVAMARALHAMGCSQKLQSLIHLGCTSEDINNLAYALMVKEGLENEWLPLQMQILEELKQLAHAHKRLPMAARTHGQLATPTTLGKEFAVFYQRLKRKTQQVARMEICGKMNGAVGNFNAHTVCFPEVDWVQLSYDFVVSLGLSMNPLTTQIEDHDSIVSVMSAMHHTSRIGIDLCRDIWGYISLGYLVQKANPLEVGSSTMPHKVNPIDFENAEGNFEAFGALAGLFMNKLPISRWQRDLSDSTVLRNLGLAFAYFTIAQNSVLKGLGKLDANAEAMNADLAEAWELLAEPVQMVLRCYGVTDAYDRLKARSRGQRLGKQELHGFIDSLQELPAEAKARLKALTPSTYVGLAEQLVEQFVV